MIKYWEDRKDLREAARQQLNQIKEEREEKMLIMLEALVATIISDPELHETYKVKYIAIEKKYADMNTAIKEEKLKQKAA